MSLLNKVYCPREVFPLANIFVAGADALVSTVVLVLLFPLNGFWPKITSLWIPLLLLVQIAFTLAITLIIASCVVYLRDLRHALPIILQLGLFVTPVAYSFHAIPAHWRTLYSIVNPLGPVIDGYRKAILLGRTPELGLLGIGAATSTLLLVIGYRLFKRLETGIADVA
jgi:ABC-2 type transport system permease protein/lipopolysaccharide transport system permease protein